MNKYSKKNIVKQERICFDCNYFFPYVLKVPSEYGICLNDIIFEPYMEELLENQNYDSCKELIEEKKFDGNVDCCKDFEMAEIIDTELSSDELNKIASCDEKKLMEVIDIALKYKPVEEYKEKLKSPSMDTRLKTYENIAGLAAYGNINALKLLIKSFKDIPPPVSLEDAHFKLKVFRFVNRNDHIDEIISILVRDLYETKSNNQTRQWISEIFKFLEGHKNKEKVKKSLTKMLGEKQFTYRIKNKIKDILNEEDYF